MIRKGQACWSAVCAKVGLLYGFIVGMFGIEVSFIGVISPISPSISKLQHYRCDLFSYEI